MKTKLLKNKKAIIGAITILIVGAISVRLFFTPHDKQNPVREREYVAKKDNITVGVETSGQINTLPNIHTFEENTVIDDMFVKVGSEVKKGDKLATVSLDKLSDLIKLAKDELSDAKAALLQASSAKDVMLRQNEKNKKDGMTSIQQEFDSKLEQLVSDKSRIQKAIKDYETKIENLEKQISELSPQVKDVEEKISYFKLQINVNIIKIGELNEKLLKVDNDSSSEINSIRLEMTKLQNENTILQQKIDSYLEDPSVSKIEKFKIEKSVAEDALTKEYTAFSLKLEEIQKTEKQYQQAVDTQGENNVFAGYKLTEELKAINENISKANRNVTYAQEKLSKLGDLEKSPTLYAQMDGIVTTLNYKSGDVVINGKPVCLIGKLSEITMTVPVSAADIGNISVGQKVNIFVDAFSEQKFTGTVTERLLVANDNGDYPVTITIDPSEQTVLPGMKAFATIVLKEKKEVLTISNKAILLENNGQYVNVKKANGEIVKTKVVTGFSDGRISEILDGLSQNDVAVVQE